MTKSTIKLTSSIRNEYSDRSTGNDRGEYYRAKGLAINAFDGVLAGHDVCLDREELAASGTWDGDEGRATISIVDEFKHCAGRAVFTWYRMPSGRYEFISYVA